MSLGLQTRSVVSSPWVPPYYPSMPPRMFPRSLCPHRNLDTTSRTFCAIGIRMSGRGRFVRGPNIYNIAKIAVLRFLVSAKSKAPLVASYVVPIEPIDILTTILGLYKQSFPLQTVRIHCKDGRRCCSTPCETLGQQLVSKSCWFESSWMDYKRS